MIQNGLVASNADVEIHISNSNNGWSVTKKLVKKSLEARINENWKYHIEPLVKQCSMLKLATEEGNNIEWLSVKYILL